MISYLSWCTWSNCLTLLSSLHAESQFGKTWRKNLQKRLNFKILRDHLLSTNKNSLFKHVLQAVAKFSFTRISNYVCTSLSKITSVIWKSATTNFQSPNASKLLSYQIWFFCGPSSWSSSQYFVFVFAAATDYLYFPLLDRLWENSSFVSCTKFYNQASNAPQYVRRSSPPRLNCCVSRSFFHRQHTIYYNSQFSFSFWVSKGRNCR